MAWAAVFAGSGSRVSIWVIWDRCARSMRASSLTSRSRSRAWASAAWAALPGICCARRAAWSGPNTRVSKKSRIWLMRVSSRTVTVRGWSGVGGGVFGVVGVVGAFVVGVGVVGAFGPVPGEGAGGAAHPPLAGAVADPSAQCVGAAGQRLRAGVRVVPGGAVLGGDALRGVE